MGPNLKRLFEQAKHLDRYDGTDDAEIVAGDIATQRLRDLFDAHGEALIEALEYYSDPALWGPVTQLVSRPNPKKARALLASIEREAGTP